MMRRLSLLLAPALACIITTSSDDDGDGDGGGDSSGATASDTSASVGTTTATSGPADGSSTAVADDSGSSSGGGDTPTLPSCSGERSELDRDDDSADEQVRVLYVVPADGDDDGYDTDDTICNSVRSWSAWLAEQSDGRALRLDTAGGALDVGFVRLTVDDATMHGSEDAANVDTGFAYVRDRIERELLLAGQLQPHKLYAVYYGGTSEYACGGGAYPPLLIGQVAAMYLGGQIPGYPACDEQPWGTDDLVPRYVDYGMLHELMHSLGAVDLLAPHEHASGHAFDEGARAPERDLMYSPREGQTDPPWGVYDPAGLVLDLGRDDYFEHGQADLVDVAHSAFLEPMPDGATLPPGW
ncbi:MAG: hypothetical protein K1X88_12095 [Nannocystaceae bacterium]|nr:hypothetical protein [Nannocystaceae bacterium]